MSAEGTLTIPVPAGPVAKAAGRHYPARLFRLLVALALPLAVLALWWHATEREWLPQQILPAPDAVWLALGDTLASGELQESMLATLHWLLVGFAIGGGLGAVLGIVTGLSRAAEEYLMPSFKAISYVPVIGWLPMWLVLLGIGDGLKIALVAQATMTPVAFNIFGGIRDVRAGLIEVGQVLCYSRWQLLTRIILPAAFPAAWAGVRFSLTKGWLALVAIELLASTEGLGFMMINARSLYQLDVMFVAVLVIGLFGFVLDRGLGWVERKVLWWQA